MHALCCEIWGGSTLPPYALTATSMDSAVPMAGTSAEASSAQYLSHTAGASAAKAMGEAEHGAGSNTASSAKQAFTASGGTHAAAVADDGGAHTAAAADDGGAHAAAVADDGGHACPGGPWLALMGEAALVQRKRLLPRNR